VALITLVEQELGEIGTVLARDAGNEGHFAGGGHVISMNLSGA